MHTKIERITKLGSEFMSYLVIVLDHANNEKFREEVKTKTAITEIANHFKASIPIGFTL
jgi:hypothetical protein